MAAVATTHSGFFLTIATPRGSTTKRVEGDLLSVGRSSDCNLSISHETMSRRHLSVMIREGQCYIEDHGSINGTFINGERIQAHAPTRVQPDDEVMLAQSGVRLCVSAEPFVRKEGLPPLPNDEKTVTSVAPDRQNQRLAALPEKRTQPESQKKAETLVLEAYKKSAQLIHESEIEAERKVEDIFKRAHEMEARTERIYHEKLNEAVRSAENMFQSAQAEAQELLDQARVRATTVRDEANIFAMELRQNTEKDCERILGDAQELARELKVHRMAEAEDLLKQKEQELIDKTRRTMNERLSQFEYDLNRQAEDRRAQVTEELKESVAKIERLKIDLEESMALKGSAETRLLEAEQATEKQKALAIQLNTEIDKSTRALQDVTQNLVGLRNEADQLTQERLSNLEALRKAQEELRVAEGRIKNTESDVQTQMLNIRAKFEEDKARLIKDEQRRLEQMKLETTQRVRALEKELLGEIETKKDRMGREIILLLDTHLKTQGDKGFDFSKLQNSLAKLLDEQIVMMSKDPGAKQKQLSLVTLRRWEKARVLIVGCAVGIAIILGVQHFNKIQLDVAPMQNQILSAIEARKADLERRKFNPPQTRDYKATYVDNVLYTEKFIDTYQGDDFQDALLQQLSPYMLRMWRVDEDKVIQLMAITTALVKSLSERKENIHPDWIPQGIEKMRAMERETSAKIVALLGSQVRADSFKKFESQFFATYTSK